MGEVEEVEVDEVLDEEPTEEPTSEEVAKAEHDERAVVAFGLQGEIFEGIARGREALWDVCKAMYEFNEINGWLALGTESQEEWLAQPEIGMTRVAYFRMVRRYKELVVLRKLDLSELKRLEPSKLDIVMPAIEDAKQKSKVKKILNDVEALGARDLREEYGPKKAEVKYEDEDDLTGGTTSGEPMSADQVGEDRAAIEAEKAKLREEQAALIHAATAVDSWISLGGDKRKAKRDWGKLLHDHPVTAAITAFNAFLNGENDIPKADAADLWITISAGLALEFEEV